jgi:cytochrome b6-f complex iron-sulfur subunit
MAAFGGATALAFGSFLLPPGAFGGDAGGEGVRLSLSDVPVGTSKMFRYQGKPCIAIRINEKTVHALSAVCTHLGCLVKWDRTKQQLVCPCHVAAFDVNGNVVGGPAPRPLQSLSVKIAQNEIIIGEA